MVIHWRQGGKGEKVTVLQPKTSIQEAHSFIAANTLMLLLYYAHSRSTSFIMMSFKWMCYFCLYQQCRGSSGTAHCSRKARPIQGLIRHYFGTWTSLVQTTRTALKGYHVTRNQSLVNTMKVGTERLGTTSKEAHPASSCQRQCRCHIFCKPGDIESQTASISIHSHFNSP